MLPRPFASAMTTGARVRCKTRFSFLVHRFSLGLTRTRNQKLFLAASVPDGSSPVTSSNSVTVSGKVAKVNHVGLSGGTVGLYQANFVIPNVIAGDHPLVITVNGVKSTPATITIGG